MSFLFKCCKRHTYKYAINDSKREDRFKTSNIIVFVNPKSGGKKGEQVLEKIKKHLEENCIYDLKKNKPNEVLSMYASRRNMPQLKILVCGGDGTVGWILSELDSVNFEKPPLVAILPLGTGNDMARAMGWGGTYKSGPLSKILDEVLAGTTVHLDRWTLTVNSLNQNQVNNQEESNTLPLRVMNNYLSFGADAKVTLDFHNAREKDPAAFSSPTTNKIVYAKKYSKEVLEQSFEHLCDKLIGLELDDKDIMDLVKQNKWHSILILNIPSYASGTNPWKKTSKTITDELQKPQSFSDCLLEVIGFKTIDFVKLHVGGHGESIAQAKKIRIKTREAIPIQVDGEPVLLSASEIIIEHKNQSTMIKKRN